MNFHGFSIVVGTNACNANCPFCISKMTASEPSQVYDINWGRFNIACRIIEQAHNGLVTVLLTGKGEPMLYSVSINAFLEELNKRGSFPLIELQTNGTLIPYNISWLKQWYKLGLTLVCISITHDDAVRNNALMRIDDVLSLGLINAPEFTTARSGLVVSRSIDDVLSVSQPIPKVMRNGQKEANGQTYDYWKAVELLHEVNLSVRLNCVLFQSGIYLPEQVERLIALCRKHGVEQLTLRELTSPNRASLADNSKAVEVFNWVDKEKSVGAINQLRHYLKSNGAVELLELPYGATVFDYHGQNICLSNCITSTTNPDDIRQLIFFPDGRISYDWKYRAARIL